MYQGHQKRRKEHVVRTRAAIVLILTVALASLLPLARAGAGGFCMGYMNG